MEQSKVIDTLETYQITRRCRPPQPQPQRPPRLVVEAEAEPSVPEPVQPRRPAPHHCRSNFATLHRTGVVRATPSFAASDLLPLRRYTATATQSTIWPWVRPSLHPPPKHRFPQRKEENLPLFMQILRVCLHGIHPIEDTS